MANERHLLTRGVIRSPFERAERSTVTRTTSDFNAADESWSESDYKPDDTTVAPIERATSLRGPRPVPISPSSPLFDVVVAAGQLESSLPIDRTSIFKAEPEADDNSAGLPPAYPDKPNSEELDFDADVPPSADLFDMAAVDFEVALRPDEAAVVDLENVLDVAFELDWQAGEGAQFERKEERPDAEWRVDIDLPEYDPDARVEPWIVPDETNDRALRKARLKAATLSSALDLSTPAEVRQTTEYLVGVYIRWRHAQTHQAMLRIAEDGLDFETLKAMVELRGEWERRTDWWLYRYRGEINQHEGCRGALTWRMAYDVCLARSEFPPDGMIDETWLADWYALRFGATGYFSFAQYVAEKVSSEEAGVLYEGLRLVPGEHREMRDPGDHHSDFYRAIRRGSEER